MAFTNMEAWSPIFVLDDTSSFDWATCAVNQSLWRQITEEYTSSRLIASIECNGETMYMALGSPVQDMSESIEKRLYLPSWVLNRLSIQGMGDSCKIQWLPQDAFPQATRIVLRPHDSAFYHADAKEELERALTRLGVLRKGDTILVPIELLGGYEIAFDITECEPANIVLADGDEVAVEFEAAWDQPPETQIPVDTEASEDAILPVQEFRSPVDVGTPLGGVTRRMPDGRPWNPYR